MAKKKYNQGCSDRSVKVKPDDLSSIPWPTFMRNLTLGLGLWPLIAICSHYQRSYGPREFEFVSYPCKKILFQGNLYRKGVPFLVLYVGKSKSVELATKCLSWLITRPEKMLTTALNGLTKPLIPPHLVTSPYPDYLPKASRPVTINKWTCGITFQHTNLLRSPSNHSKNSLCHLQGPTRGAADRLPCASETCSFFLKPLLFPSPSHPIKNNKQP